MDLQTALTGFQTKQRKILEPVDHGKIQYESYRKNFYVEVPELAKMSTEGRSVCRKLGTDALILVLRVCVFILTLCF